MRKLHGLFIEELEQRVAPVVLTLPPQSQAPAHASLNAPFQEPIYTTMMVGEEDGGHEFSRVDVGIKEEGVKMMRDVGIKEEGVKMILGVGIKEEGVKMAGRVGQNSKEVFI